MRAHKVKTVQTIDWKPFTKKHADYIRKADDFMISVAEGAVRSGKTIDNCIIAWKYLMTTSDRLHLATGSSVHNAKLNIGDCNGFGLEFLFKGRCRWGKYRDNEALFIYPRGAGKSVERVVIFAGGGHSDSYKGILGNSYGLWIATEINEHYDSEDSRLSFLKVAMARQLAAKNPKILWDLNPSSPGAAIYRDYIEPFRENGSCNYAHFTIYDNGSLDAERIREIEARYVKGSVWYNRDILGLRCVAEGLIYRRFAEDSDSFRADSDNLPKFRDIIVGCDWGGNKSFHAFCATGITSDYAVYALCAVRYAAKDTDANYVSERFNEFVDFVEGKYGRITDGYGDSEGQTIKNTVSNNGAVFLRNSLKNPIKDRIDALMFLIATNKFYFTDDAECLKKALAEAVWDPKNIDRRLDDGTSDIDILDAFEYSFERYLSYYIN